MEVLVSPVKYQTCNLTHRANRNASSNASYSVEKRTGFFCRNLLTSYYKKIQQKLPSWLRQKVCRDESSPGSSSVDSPAQIRHVWLSSRWFSCSLPPHPDSSSPAPHAASECPSDPCGTPALLAAGISSFLQAPSGSSAKNKGRHFYQFTILKSFIPSIHSKRLGRMYSRYNLC